MTKHGNLPKTVKSWRNVPIPKFFTVDQSTKEELEKIIALGFEKFQLYPWLQQWIG